LDKTAFDKSGRINFSLKTDEQQTLFNKWYDEGTNLEMGALAGIGLMKTTGVTDELYGFEG